MLRSSAGGGDPAGARRRDGVTELRRLKHVADVRFSSVDKKAVDGQIDVKLCNYTDVYYNERIVADIPFMDATTTPDQIVAFTLRGGDVLLTKDSETADDIGVSAYVPHDLPGVLCGYHLATARPRPSAIDGRFLRWALVSTASRQQLERAATGVTRFGLRQDVVGGMTIPVPSLREQVAVADYLDAETARIDTLVAARERTAELAGQRLDIVVRQSVSGGADGRPYPSMPLRRRWTVVDCKHRTPEYQPEGYPVVSPGDATPGRLDLTRCTRFVGRADFDDLTEGVRRPRRGDIIYTRNASIGIASFVETDEPFSMGQDVCLIRSRDQEQRFLTYVLNTLGMDQLEEHKIGSTFSRINVAQVLDLTVPYLSLDVQRRIADALDEATSLTTELRAAANRQVKLLLERRQALITAAVTGQLEIPGASA